MWSWDLGVWREVITLLDSEYTPMSLYSQFKEQNILNIFMGAREKEKEREIKESKMITQYRNTSKPFHMRSFVRYV